MTTDSDSASEISALKGQLFTQLIALIVISGTLTVYLYRQASVTHKDLEAVRPQAQQMINGFAQNQGLVLSFAREVQAYAQAHPEFRPVLAKNGLGLTTGMPAAAPAAPSK